MAVEPEQDPRWIKKESEASLRRLLPLLERSFKAAADSAEWDHFESRLRRHFPHFFACFHELYGREYDFFFYLSEVLESATAMWHERSDELKALDATREADPE